MMQINKLKRQKISTEFEKEQMYWPPHCIWRYTVGIRPLMWIFSIFLGVTGLVTTDDKNARNIDVDLWAMTDQETGEYGVSLIESDKQMTDLTFLLKLFL